MANEAQANTPTVKVIIVVDRIELFNLIRSIPSGIARSLEIADENPED